MANHLQSGGMLVLELEIALFYIDIEQHYQLLVPTSHLHTLKTKIPEADSIIDKEPGRFGMISGEIADRSVVLGCGFHSGIREARDPKPRKGFFCRQCGARLQRAPQRQLGVAQNIAARVCSVLPCSRPLTYPRLCPADGSAGCGPGGRWVGILVKAAVSLPVLCSHVRRETLTPTQLGVA